MPAAQNTANAFPACDLAFLAKEQNYAEPVIMTCDQSDK